MVGPGPQDEALFIAAQRVEVSTYLKSFMEFFDTTACVQLE
jgi:hypothetical protein